MYQDFRNIQHFCMHISGSLSVKVASSSDFCFPTKDYFYFLIAMAPVTRQYAAELCRSHKGTLPYIDDPHLVPHMTDVRINNVHKEKFNYSFIIFILCYR